MNCERGVEAKMIEYLTSFDFLHAAREDRD